MRERCRPDGPAIRRRRDMRVRVVAIVLVALMIPALGWSKNGPRITFDKQTHDYGKVRYGEKVVEEFAFTNTGDETLVIESLRATCGCTKAIKGDSEIRPGKASKIVAEFDTADLRPGLKQKSVFVHSNDPNNPVIKLNLTADVVRDLNLNPPSLLKKLHEYTHSVTFPVKISNTSDHAYNVTGLDVTGSDLRVSLKPEKVAVAPQGSAEFEVKIDLEKEAHRQFYMGKLVLHTDHPTERQIEVPCHIRLEQIGQNHE
jgi:hypothetical protein